MSILDTDVRSRLLNELRKIERLPFGEGEMSLDDLRKRRYPFNRALQSYVRKLPDLDSFLSSGLTVLDIGAGDGSAISEIAFRYPDGQYFATGISPQDIEPVEYRIATANQLPFGSCCFDLVISVHAISWEFDQIGAIREIIRV